MPAQPAGAAILAAAQTKLGQRYVLGAQAPLDDPLWGGPWDCAELASWAVYQAARKVYGCVNDKASPHNADPYTGAWLRDAKALGVRISIAEASVTPGAMLLFRGAAGGHIAISDGTGDGTVEARNSTWGVTRHVVHGRIWTTGVLVPGIAYARSAETSGGAPSGGPDRAHAPTASARRYVAPPPPSAEAVRAAQVALREGGFLHEEPNGHLDPATQAAAREFQIRTGLTPLGWLDEETLEALRAGSFEPARSR
jgi:hypothetical protein